MTDHGSLGDLICYGIIHERSAPKVCNRSSFISEATYILIVNACNLKGGESYNAKARKTNERKNINKFRIVKTFSSPKPKRRLQRLVCTLWFINPL